LVAAVAILPVVRPDTDKHMAPSDKKAASPLKLLIGVVGIYGAFMYYGQLQGDIVLYKDKDGNSLDRTWFVQTMEAAANVIVGIIGIIATQGGPSKNIPYMGFIMTGTTQVLAKAMTQQSQIFGVPFFVATLVKNAKMVPVMIGGIFAGEKYEIRKYMQVALIIGGVVLVTVGKSKKAKGGADKHNDTEIYGMACLMLALVCDGLTGGYQKKMQKQYEKDNSAKLQPFDIMLFTNLMMLFLALGTAMSLDQLWSGLAFLQANPEIYGAVFKFSVCSALGQSAIFFTIANFDPLITTTVTTTRKIFSVLLDIVSRGHVLNEVQWGGIAVATLGVIGELQETFASKSKAKAK